MISLFDDYLEESMQKAKNDSTILESMNGELYEVLTESSIKDKAIQILNFIIKILKSLYNKLKNLISAVVSKFKISFSKDDVLINKVALISSKPQLLLTNNIITVKYRRFNLKNITSIMHAGITPIEDSNISPVVLGVQSNLCEVTLSSDDGQVYE